MDATVLTNDDVQKYLYDRANETDKTASAYWRSHGAAFEVDETGAVSGNYVLGQFVQSRGLHHHLVHWLLQTPFRRMGRPYAYFRQAEKLGRLVAKRQGRIYTSDIQRQALTVAVCHEYVRFESDGDAVFVIGDGFGALSSICALAWPTRKVIIANLTKPLLLDVVGFRRAVPDKAVALARTAEEMNAALASADVGLIAIQADDAAVVASAPLGLVANVVSMQEMNYDVIAAYFDIIRRNPAAATTFYCANKQSKVLEDGTDVIFDDYGWRDGDEVLLDEPCPWSMLVYSGRPPFYRKRTWNLIRHRVARMEKILDGREA